MADKWVFATEVVTGGGVRLAGLSYQQVLDGLKDGWISPDDRIVTAAGSGPIREVLRENEIIRALADPEAAHRRFGTRVGLTGTLALTFGAVFWFYLPSALPADTALSTAQRLYALCCLLVWIAGATLAPWAPILIVPLGFLVFLCATGIDMLEVGAKIPWVVLFFCVKMTAIGTYVGRVAGAWSGRKVVLTEFVPVPEVIQREHALHYDLELKPRESGEAEGELPGATEPPRRKDGTISITLVPGTFARRANWTRLNSALCSTLRDAFPKRLTFEGFDWSTWNSHSARLRAAEKLRGELLARVSAQPETQHFVIAHSHGGTVASYALADAQLQSRIAGVVYLGTPFLCMAPRKVGPAAALVRRIGSMMGISLLLWWGYGTGAVMVGYAGALAVDSAGWDWVCPVLMLAMLICVIAYTGDEVEALVISRRGARFRKKLAAKLDTSRHPRIPLLCVYDSHDEARVWLRTLNRTAAHFMRWQGRVPVRGLFWAGVAVSVVLGYWLHWWPDMEENYRADLSRLPAAVHSGAGLYSLISQFWITRQLAKLILAALSAPLVSALFLAVAAAASFVLQVATQKLLVGSFWSMGSASAVDVLTAWKVGVRVLARPRNAYAIGARCVGLSTGWRLKGLVGLNHSALYRREDVRQEIVAWIRGHADGVAAAASGNE